MASGGGVVAKAVAKPRQLWRATTSTILLSLRHYTLLKYSVEIIGLAKRGRMAESENRSPQQPPHAMIIITTKYTSYASLKTFISESSSTFATKQILETLMKMDSCKEDAANVDKLVLLLQTKKVAALRVWMSKKRKLGELLEMDDCVVQQPVKCSFTNVV
ncbi:hypothetical protein Tco_0962471 [Tanacetum coccineum]